MAADGRQAATPMWPSMACPPDDRFATGIAVINAVSLSYAGVMGVAIEVLIVDWPRVEAAAPGDREELLSEAAFGEAYSDDLFEHGWSWSTQPGEDWYRRYAFRNTLGSYKPQYQRVPSRGLPGWTIRPVYRFENGGWELHTMFADRALAATHRGNRT
ncbi:hypothetical protein [Streptomyces sp. NPDC001340]